MIYTIGCLFCFIIQTSISKYYYEGEDWSEKLFDISFSINAEKQTSTKYTPYYLLFGRDAKIPHDMLKSDEEIDISLCDKNIDNNIREAEVKRNDINKKVLENIKNAQGKQKKYYEQVRSSRYKCFNLKVGDKVLRKNFESLKKVGGKLKPKWLGNYLIHSIDKHNRIILKDLKKNKILKKIFPYAHLKPYIDYKIISSGLYS